MMSILLIDSKSIKYVATNRLNDITKEYESGLTYYH